ncbi:MAG: phosphate ABC transporter substrate-binding protein PstS [Alphaproteobacteria bacterium]|nr:phosphate ABC transporter substrate-binding protein PstS [Alphaproteobacteria bacterium]
MNIFRIGLFGVAVVAAIAFGAQAAEVSGGGATFPYPIYARWAEAYAAKTGLKMSHQSIGSGGGIRQIGAKRFDFGASDMPLKPADLEKGGLTQFPVLMGGVVPVINVPGIKPGQIRLDGKVLANIFLGNITKWNDPAIAALNSGLELPDLAVAPVYRSDGSGTTFIFTHYLSEISPVWKSKIGENISVAFPSGIGAKGSEGVAAITSRTVGAIGYVEYAYAKQAKLPYAQLRNRDGAFVSPTRSAFRAAAANVDWAKTQDFYLLLTNRPGKDSWPITGATFILLHKQQSDPKVAREVINFFDWAYREGGKLAKDLDYVPMPENVIKLVEQSWHQIKGPDGKPVWGGPGS